MNLNFSNLTRGIYGFVDSLSRIRGLDGTVNMLERLSKAVIRLRRAGISLNTGKSRKIIEESTKPLNLMDRIFKRLGISTKNVKDNVSSISRNLRILTIGAIIRGLSRLLNMTIRLGKAVYDLVKLYAEYKENINLATVAYNGLERAPERLYPFVEKISKAFGLNESEVIRSVGLFKQMANAMGLTQETGELLSETLTKMAYDISSLYNISFERSMSVLQASLSGQTKPINSSSFTWKHVLKNLVNVCKNGVAIIRKVFKQEMAYSYCC